MDGTSIPLLIFAFANDQESKASYLRLLVEERRAIEAALDPAVRAGWCETKMLPNATIKELFAAFQDQRYRDRIVLFHYGGHAGSIELQLEREGQENENAHNEGIVALFKACPNLKVVFLNGCSTQNLAIALNEQGIPIVIGSYEAIQDKVAQQLAEQFYFGLGQGLSLKRAWDESIARIKTIAGGDTRGLVLDEAAADRAPWDIFIRRGAEQVENWNLPDATGNPLAAIPLPEGQYDLPNEPFRFLDRYRQKDAPVFFGRGHAIRELHDRLTNPHNSPIILLSGQSGVGKSSLLEAGLLPRLASRSQILYFRYNPTLGLLGTLQQAIQEKAPRNDSMQSLLDTWKEIESTHSQPLLCIFDQVEEVFTQATTPDLEDFVLKVKAIFDTPRDRPKGKLLLGFRKEYELEVKDLLIGQEIPFELIMLKRLSRKEIKEVVNGLASTPQLVAKYNIAIDPDLSETIANDLLVDADTPVAPVLQIILTKLWQINRDKAEALFSIEEYLALKEQGIFLGDFFRQQTQVLQQWEQESGHKIESSGLLLDLLHSHVSALGYAHANSIEELKNIYQHRADVLEKLIQKCKELYLLTDVGDKLSTLSHDTLAPVILQAFAQSGRPGQQASRILKTKTEAYQRTPEHSYLDDQELKLVEQGKTGMRMWTAVEAELVEISQQQRKKRRYQKAVTFGFFALLLVAVTALSIGYWQSKQIEQLANQARLESLIDPSQAIETLTKALKRRPDNQTLLLAHAAVYNNNEFYTTLLRHPDPVKGVLFYDDAKRNVISWTENRLYRWDDQKITAQFEAKEQITVVALSPDKKTLILAFDDGSLARLEVSNLRQERKEKLGQVSQVAQLCFSTDGKTLYVADYTQHLMGLDANNLTQVKFSMICPEAISSLKTDPLHHSILIGYENGSCETRNEAGQLIRTIPGQHKDRVLDLSASVSNTLASVGRDGQLLLRNPAGNSAQGAPILTIKGHERSINAIDWTKEHQLFLSASNDYLIKSWSESGDLVATYRGHSNFVNAIAVTAKGDYFASAGEDKSVRIWKVDSKVVRKFGPHAHGVSALLIDQGGKRLLSSSDQGENDAGESLNDLNFTLESLLNLQFGAFPQAISAWKLDGGHKAKEWLGHNGGINAMATDKSGTQIVSASSDSSLILWTPQGKIVKQLKGTHRGKILDVSMAPDGKHLVSVGEDSLCVLWSNQGKVLTKMRQGDLIRCVAFSPNGQYFATGAYDGRVNIYDLQGKLYQSMLAPSKNRIECLDFSPDGQQLLVGTWGTKASLYKLGAKSPYLELELPNQNKTGAAVIKAVCFSPKGDKIAIGSEGGLVQLFQLKDGRALALQTLQIYPQKAILSLCFSQNGGSIFAGSNDQWARLWKLEGLNKTR